MNAAEIKKQREELEAYYNNLYEQDEKELKKFILQYTNGDENLTKAFLEGYNYSFKQPNSKTIRLIVMYTLDYIPYYKKSPSIKNITTNIRDIFKNNIYPKELLDKNIIK